jgi:starvation-inducible DNA-binding protein
MGENLPYAFSYCTRKHAKHESFTIGPDYWENINFSLALEKHSCQNRVLRRQTAPPLTKERIMDIGISKNDREEISAGLSRLLADSYTLYLKTHNFHWNVTGPMFNTLHLMFMNQYTELWNALDLIAERIRALGFPAPGTYREFAALTVIQESEGVPSAVDMIKQLVAGQEAVVKTARSIFPVVSRIGDEPSADLLTQRMQIHEKNAWMLRSMLEG